MKAIQTYNLVITEGEFKGYFRMTNIANREVAEQLKNDFNADCPNEPCEVVEGRIEHEVEYDDLFD